MTTDAQRILDELRALPPSERLRVVEKVVHEVAAEVGSPSVQASGPIWNDESDEDFNAFQSALQELRASDIWRADNGSNAR